MKNLSSIILAASAAVFLAGCASLKGTFYRPVLATNTVPERTVIVTNVAPAPPLVVTNVVLSVTTNVVGSVVTNREFFTVTNFVPFMVTNYSVVQIPAVEQVVTNRYEVNQTAAGTITTIGGMVPGYGSIASSAILALLSGGQWLLNRKLKKDSKTNEDAGIALVQTIETIRQALSMSPSGRAFDERVFVPLLKNGKADQALDVARKIEELVNQHTGHTSSFSEVVGNVINTLSANPLSQSLTDIPPGRSLGELIQIANGSVPRPNDLTAQELVMMDAYLRAVAAAKTAGASPAP